MNHQAANPDTYRFILQQDAPEPLVRAEVEEVTPEILIEHSIRQFEHLPIDVYGSDANHAGGTYYRSDVAERMLTRPQSFRGRDHVRMAERLQKLFDSGTDPLEIYCAACHEAGKDYMIQLRMNDLHDVVGDFCNIDAPNRGPEDVAGEPYYYTSGWKADHPECLLGDPTDGTPRNSYRGWERHALNYALGKVRQYIYGMAEELITRYDLDIFEMDFIRFTFYFRQAEAYGQRHVLTELVRRIRGLCEETGKRRGRPVRLSARVPETLELGLRAGIDTGEWLKEGLLDMVTIGGGYCPFGTPWEEVGDPAKAAGIPHFACLNHGNFAKDTRRIHAAAHRAMESGVAGFKLWNFWYCFDVYHPQGENPMALDFVEGIVDRDGLVQRPLSYVVDRVQDPEQFVGPAHFHHGWPGQLPMTIGMAEDGIGQVITFDIPGSAIAARKPEFETRLVMEIRNYWAPEDRLELYWNGRRVEDVVFHMRANEGAEPYQVLGSLRCGDILPGSNRLELRLVKFHPEVDPFLSLVHAELLLPDGNGNLPAVNPDFPERLY
jgi:hypothetical protein